MIILKRGLLLLLLIFFLLLLGIAYLTMTHGGMQRLFSLGQSYAQGELSWGESSGSLKGPAKLNDILYVSDTGASVKIDRANFDWKPKRLLSRTLEINEFEFDGVVVRLPPPDDQPAAKSEPFELRDLALPVATNIENFKISNVKLYPHGADTPIVLDNIELAADARSGAMKLVSLRVSAPQGELRLGGSISTTGDWPVDIEQMWRFDHPQFGLFTGQGSMTGDVKTLTVNSDIKGAANASFNAQVKDVTGKLSWNGTMDVRSDDLGPFSAALNSVPLSLDATTEGTLQQYNVDGIMNSEPAQTGPLAVDFALEGNMDRLQINKTVVTLEESTATAAVTGYVGLADPQSDIQLRWTDVSYPLIAESTDEVSGEAPAALVNSPEGIVRISGADDNYSINVVTSVTGDDSGVADIKMDIDGSSRLINIKSATVDTAVGDTDLNLSGIVDLQDERIDINANWQALGWPIPSEQSKSANIFTSENGRFSISGPFNDYQLDADFLVDGVNVPQGQWELTGSGNRDALDNLNLTGRTLDGLIKGRGIVGWTPVLEWTFDFEAQQINPAVKWPGMDGQIELALTTAGSIEESGPNIQAAIKNIGGHYRDQPLSGSGELSVLGDRIEIDRLNVVAGKADVSVHGQLGDELNLQWQLDAPSLDKLVEGLGGTVDVKGNIGGTAADPAADFSIDVSDFKSAALSIKSIEGGGTIDLAGGEKSTVNLQATQLSSGDQSWEKLLLSGAGLPDKHTVDLTLTGPAAQVLINAQGGIGDDGWTGSVDKFDLRKADIGDWTLAQPIAVSANASRVSADRFCLGSDPSSVCVDGRWSAAQGLNAKLDVDPLQAKHFSSFLPPDIEIDAALTGTASLVTNARGEPTAMADLTVAGGDIDYLDNGEPVNNKLGNSRLQFELRDDNLKSDLDLDLGDIGTVSGVATVENFSTSKILGGTIKTNIEDISIVSIFAPDMQSVDGKFDTDVELGGTLDAPRVIGDTGLGGLVAEIPFIGMKVFDGSMNASSDGKGGLNVEGTVTAGDGELALTGAVDPATGNMKMAVVGENFQLANTNRQRIIINPDLMVEMEGENMTVTGTVHIPSAYIQAGGEDAVIMESADVVIVNSDDDTDDAKPENKVKLDIKVTLGDDIRVKAGQFDGALGGGLTIAQQPGRVATGSGAIEVLSGDFLVYGQKLTMERGRILFGGGPIDNPALEIDVARDVSAYNVKAGARVRGTAKAPLLQLQSEPAQTDANTLSFILLGKPVGTAGVSYTLGKFITPDIYVSYGIDLFEKIRTFNLRYKISERLSLIAAQSTTSSADLIYTFER